MALHLLQRLALFARRRYGWVFLATALLIGISVVLISRLRLDSDILALLPENNPAVQTFRQTLEEFGSLDYLIVAIRIPEGAMLDPYESLADQLGARLGELDTLQHVDYKISAMGELIKTFLPQSLLFLDPDARSELAEKLTDDRLEGRVKEIRRLLTTPQALAMKQLVLLDPLGVTEIFLDRLSGTRAGLSLDLASGYLLSTDRRMLLILAQPLRPAQDVEFGRELVASVEAEVASVVESWGDMDDTGTLPAPEVVLGGRYVIAAGDEALIKRDVTINVVTSMAGVLILFLFAFRRLGLLAYAFVPLASGLVLAFGFSALVFGRLNAASSGVAALLIGLGIDFVIVSYGRYVEERRRGADPTTALMTMSGSSGRAVVVGGITSAATFYAFGVTEFTGLREMGLLTGTGILLCMAAVLLLLPAMLAWSEERYQRRDRIPRLFLHGMGSGRVIRGSVRRPWLTLSLAGLISAAALYSAFDLEFEDSVQSMRPKGNPGVEIRDEVAERFGAGFDQMMLVSTADSLDEVLELADRAALGAAALVEEGVLTGYDSVASMLPPPRRQTESLAWLESARQDVLDPARIRATFAATAAAEGLRLDPFLEGLDLFTQAVEREQPIGLEDFAGSREAETLLRRYLRRTSDVWKCVVYLHPPAQIWRREAPPEAVRLAEGLGPGVVLTGANVVSRTLREQVLKDALVAGGLGFVLVALLLWWDYRRILDTLLSLAPLLLGILWMLGAMAALGLPMNFMNIFVTTMIIGIGVDYGVHMLHRYRELQAEDDEKLVLGMAETGKAIVLAALSTIVGFGSLSLSHYPGLSSMGGVAILGAIASSVVAITVLPAYLTLRRRHRAKG